MYKNVKVHFIGIGGASMSALAEYVLAEGGIVSGSDKEYSQSIERLSTRCHVLLGENPRLVESADMVVYSSAISPDNAELVRAKALQLPIFERRQFLSLIGEDFSKTVAIGGTHGKTTVTAMIIHVLKTLQANFSAHVGGDTEYGSFVANGKDLFVTEACEYKGSLLDLNPHTSIVLNAELDHPDCYQDMKSLCNVFFSFLSKASTKVVSTEFLNVCKDVHMFTSENWNSIYSSSAVEAALCAEDGVVVFSNGKVDLWTYLHTRVEYGVKCSETTVCKNGKRIGIVPVVDQSVNTPINTLTVVAVLDSLGFEVAEVSKSLASFKGVKRRNEVVGSLSGARVVFDYAHHPTQIKGMLLSYTGKNLVVFQPHTYSRTRAYFDGFVSELSRADTLIIMETYGAREVEHDGPSSEVLWQAISTKFAKDKVYLAKTDDETIELVKTLSQGHDNVLFLGAGDIYRLKDKLNCDKK